MKGGKEDFQSTRGLLHWHWCIGKEKRTFSINGGAEGGENPSRKKKKKNNILPLEATGRSKRGRS